MELQTLKLLTTEPMELITNRYSQVAPTAILPNGASLSVPVYVSLTTEQSKTILNAVREIIREQRLEMGHNPVRESDYGVTVETAVQLPQTPIEIEIGCDESNLRNQLFARQGISERFIVKLQKLTGLEFFTKEQLEEVQALWSNYLFGTNEPKTTKRATKTSKTRTKKPATATAS